MWIFPEVVHHAGQVDAAHLVLRQAHVARDGRGEFGDAALVARGVRVAHFHGAGNHLDGGLHAALQPLRALFVRAARAQRDDAECHVGRQFAEQRDFALRRRHWRPSA